MGTLLKFKKDCARLTKSQEAFTIVELLIVIVVIAILAAIIIISYNGIQTRARISALQSDLNTAAKRLDVFKVSSSSDTYPTSLDCSASPANNTICLASFSSSTTYQYAYSAAQNSYCVTATNGALVYNYSSITRSFTEGACSGHVGVTVPPNGGVVTTVATSTSGINDPRGIVVDASGNIFVTNSGTAQILKITPGGVASVFAGSGTNATVNGIGTAAAFNAPGGLAIDGSNNLYVGECNGHRIRKITPDAVVSIFAGAGVAGSTDGSSTTARFYCPQGVAIDSSGNLFVADGSNHKIRKVTPSGEVSTIAGTGVSGFANGAALTVAQFNNPVGIAVAPDGTIYVNDDSRSRVRKIINGEVSTLAGSGVQGYLEGTGEAAQVSTQRSGLAVDTAGTVYLADGANNRIRKITPAGVTSLIAGSGTSGSLDGTGVAARFAYPRNIFVTPDGKLYVTDNTTSQIRKIE